MRGAGAAVHFQAYGGEPSLSDCIAVRQFRKGVRIRAALTCISHHPTAEARGYDRHDFVALACRAQRTV
ncbi:MAG: hypothetical protein OXH92_22385, partial [Bryobacterales bacterium]|nr:hypothetical protein [Bryobacterales bacterium]